MIGSRHGVRAEQEAKMLDSRLTLSLLLPKLIDIVEHHLKGTLFGS